jgi:nucleolar protein 56
MIMEKRRMRILDEMKAKIRKAHLSRDNLMVFADSAYSDLEKQINILFERLTEWYGVYFPELKLEDRVKYCNLVLQIDKKDFQKSKKAIQSILGEKAEGVVKSLQNTMGADLDEKDLDSIKLLAQQILALEETKDQLEKYIGSLAKEVCPNLSEVGGPKIAAKLIAHVGSLEKLAKLPASTIQVLGAEKALFKHLRRKTKPPKHGIIFQHTIIHSAPKDKRGRLARTLASKLAIAAKVDAYGKGHFVGKELREDFEKRVKEIMNEKE